MNIQAIETFYKGYRFRSRLEARWAVFFNELGIKWQYEVEGFELPSGRYLPDFYLPDYKCYFEVKPPPVPRETTWRPSVYMAGRMEEPCWRPFSVYDPRGTYDDIPIPRVMSFNGRPILYTGPYRTDLSNHSFLHGLDGAQCCGEKEVFERSIAGIKACEVFFAWFDDLEAFGTLVEVGIAHALRKRIVIGFGSGLLPDKDDDYRDEMWFYGGSAHNLWFATECAEKLLHGDKEDVLKQFDGWLAEHYPMPRELTLAHDLRKMTKAGIYVVYGDPVEAFSRNSVDGSFIRWGECIFDNDNEKLFISPTEQDAAALKARQARFEHGQTPN